MIKPPQVLPEEPTAVTPHGGFCGGKSQQWLRYPTKPPARICEGEAEWPSYSTATIVAGAIVLENGFKYAIDRARPEAFFGVVPESFS